MADGGWNRERVDAFSVSFREFLNSVYVNSKELGGHTCLGEHIYRAQEMFLDGIFDALGEDKHDIYVLKSRQLGCSTIARALSLFWLGMHDGLQGAMVFDTSYNTARARREIVGMIRNLPKAIQFPRIMEDNRDGIILENDSQLLFMAAGVTNNRTGGGLGRSVGLNFVHCCMAPGTPVLVEHGREVSIENIRVGQEVVTHTGQKGRVIANIGRFNDRGPMIKITPWLGAGILMTEDHKVPTNRGLLPARDIKKSDLLVMPIRQIKTIKTVDYLPLTPTRIQGGGSLAAAQGKAVDLNEEMGFALGYYVAEGSINYQRRGERYYEAPSGIVLSRHRNEVAYASRAISAFAEFTTGKRTTKDYASCLTTAEILYGSSLARWVEGWFGARDEKHIPDDVFECGSEFCRGVLAGLLSGDGSKGIDVADGYAINRIALTSTRSSIAHQARDLAASLGYGWASVKYRPAGYWYGRNCKECWTVTWCGRAAAGLRQLIGLPVVPGGRASGERYAIADGKVFIKIRKLERGIECPYMYDLSVDHPDHTFRTPHMAVSNSEICSWTNEEGLTSFRQSLSEDYPDRLYLWESTARGFNSWHDLWSEAKEDEAKATYFFGWWAKDNQIIERDTRDWIKYGTEPPTPSEIKRIIAVKEMYDWDITPEQLAWYRKKSDPTQEREEGEPEDIYLLAEQPWTEDEAFQQTGSTFFVGERLTQISQRLATQAPPQAFRFVPGVNNFVESEFYPARTRREMELKIWEEPFQDSTYIVSADPAFGRDENNDNSASQVVRCFADGIDQVAEYATATINPHQFAWLLWALVGYYGAKPNNRVMMICEINGPGEELWRQYQTTRQLISSGYLRGPAERKGIANIADNARTYIYQRSDSQAMGHAFQFKTQVQTKVQMLEATRNYVNTGTLFIRSQEVVEEMKVITRDGDTISAPSSKRDDRTFALALATRCWDDRIRRGLVSGNRTREAEKARLSLSIIDQYALFNRSTLDYFLKDKETQRAALVRQAIRANLRGSNGAMRRLIPATRRF